MQTVTAAEEALAEMLVPLFPDQRHHSACRPGLRTVPREMFPWTEIKKKNIPPVQQWDLLGMKYMMLRG